MRIATLLIVAMLGLLLLAGGCRRSRKDTPADVRYLPVTAQHRAMMAAEVEFGKRLHRKDNLAARATDMAMGIGILPQDTRVEGWVVDMDGEKPAVYLMGNEPSGPIAYHAFLFGSATRAQYVKDPETTERHRSLFRVRQTGLDSLTLDDNADYNTVVLDDGERWLVYVLEATSEPNVMIAGRHSKVTVCKKNGRTLDVTILGKISVRIPMNPDPTAGSILLSECGTAIPSAVHVHLSMLHNRTLLVITDTGIWKVQQERVSLAWPVHKRTRRAIRCAK